MKEMNTEGPLQKRNNDFIWEQYVAELSSLYFISLSSSTLQQDQIYALSSMIKIVLYEPQNMFDIMCAVLGQI